MSSAAPIGTARGSIGLSCGAALTAVATRIRHSLPARAVRGSAWSPRRCRGAAPYLLLRDAQPRQPGFDDDLPYAVLVVELAEQAGLITVGNLRECAPDQIRIGMPVEVVFEAVTDEVTLPQWRPPRP